MSLNAPARLARPEAAAVSIAVPARSARRRHVEQVPRSYGP